MGFVEQLENSIDIVDLVGRYTKLKKSGTSYKALCPFPGHSEKTPSFVVSPAKQIAYCFGCHKGGGPLKFIMDIENCEFREAVQILGNLTGKEVGNFHENPEKIELQKNLYSLLKDISRFYSQALEKFPEVKKYLFERGITSEDIEKFSLGYSSSGVELYNFLKDKGYDDSLINESEIFLDIKKRKEKFIGRVIFPIQNNRGDIVAFAGRILGKGEPKYLNSPASPIYDKSSILYGLFLARHSITKSDSIILVEGYMDAIALHRAGITQAVAISGTALTEKHIPIIKRLTHKIYLCLDMDKAGENATKLSLEILKNKEVEVKIIELHDAKDPDEFLEKGGDFEDVLKHAKSPIAYLMEKSDFNPESLDEKRKFIDDILGNIKNYSDSIEQDMYIKELSKKADTPLSVLYELFRKKKKAPEDTSPVMKKTEIKDSLEFNILSALEQGEIDFDELQRAALFPEFLPEKIQKYLQEKNFDFLPTEEKLYIKALSLKKEEILTKDSKNSKKLSLFDQLNKQSYKIAITQIKKDIIAGKIGALEKYSHILSLAKKNSIK